MAGGLVSFVSLSGVQGLAGERALQRLEAADVVVPDGDTASASELAALAFSGKRVARVVPGDALESVVVLEEVLALARARVAFEIVPGVGARSLAAAYAGVVGRTVRAPAAVVGKAVEREPRDAVVTLVASVGTPRQRVVVTTAGEAAERARAMGEAELLVAVGAPDDELRWFERRPLFGKRVLVTRPRESRAAGAAGSTAVLLGDEGAEAIVLPTIRIVAPADPAPLARALEELAAGAYAWVAFTSANGVERTWEAVRKAGRDARTFGGARLAAIGPATARALEQHGLHADVTAKEFRGEGLAEAMLEALGGKPARVLLARAAKAREALPQALRAAGCTVDVVPAYETHPASRETMDTIGAELELGGIDAVTFTSSSTVEHLCEALGERAAPLLGKTRVASIGPVTSAAARARGIRVDVEPSAYTLPGLIRALADSYAKPVA